MFAGKSILIISPQSWGVMHLAKHHYAIELAKAGATVYFLNPPTGQHNFISKTKISIEPAAIANLFIISHQTAFPYRIKFHLIKLFHFFMQWHVKSILKHIPTPIDIVWSFDIGNLIPLPYFGNKVFKIFMPVDEPLVPQAIEAAKGADFMFSITHEILEKYQAFNVPKHFIHHGLSQEFINNSTIKNIQNKRIHVGMSGNWLRTDIDVPILKQIIGDNPNITFELWGSYTAKQSNISGGTDADASDFVAYITQAPNVKLHGPVHTAALAHAIQSMDAFLICYDILKDQSKGTNYHKIMEYLSTGKVIISNNVSTYATMPTMITMTAERTHNNALPELFHNVITNLDYYNNTSSMNQRLAFAHSNTYTNHINNIQSICMLHYHLNN